MNRFLFVWQKQQWVRIKMEDIIYLQAANNNSRLIMQQHTLLIQSSLKDAIAKLPLEMFCQVHPRYIINIAYIRHFNHESIILVNQTEIPISERYRKRLMKQLFIIARP